MRRVVIALVLAGCPSKQPVNPSYTAAGPKPCERMADHLVGLMTPTDANGKPIAKEQETADAITRVLIERCTKDQWTMDAQQCFLDLKQLGEADRCAEKLTVDQRNAMDAAMDKALGPRPEKANGAVGAPGSPPPPPPAPTRGVKPRDSDPCQGGEEDPCQGGQKK
jgi:hypothetical protein